MCCGIGIPAPKPTAPPVTMATLPANLPLGDVVTGVVSDVVGTWDAMIAILWDSCFSRAISQQGWRCDEVEQKSTIPDLSLTFLYI
jgi:hypothetical protein